MRLTVDGLQELILNASHAERFDVVGLCSVHWPLPVDPAGPERLPQLPNPALWIVRGPAQVLEDGLDLTTEPSTGGQGNVRTSLGHPVDEEVGVGARVGGSFVGSCLFRKIRHGCASSLPFCVSRRTIFLYSFS